MKTQATFNQITLITDGCSNCGISPIEAAEIAKRSGINVNVIGIVDGGSMNSYGAHEVKSIAEAGGGLSRIVNLDNISKTIQFVTRQAMTNTIKQVVDEQLNNIFKSRSANMNEVEEAIPIADRLKTVQVVENLAEYSDIKVLLLIDQSSSMIKKMKKVEEAILDFFLSLESRSGESKISVATYPDGQNGIDVKIPWTQDIKSSGRLIGKLKPRGNTPTGSAIISSVRYFDYATNSFKGKGVFDEYII